MTRTRWLESLTISKLAAGPTSIDKPEYPAMVIYAIEGTILSKDFI
ncbi:MAG: hypothetical protein AB7F96_20165 [Beijerinckiaceae bacterium]